MECTSDSEWEQNLEEAAAAIIVCQIRQRRKRRFWVHPINLKREKRGTFHCLVKELDENDGKFHNYFRMSKAAFNNLHDLVKDGIKKKNTKFRKSISSKERLALCLRFLATGESYRSLAFSYRMGSSTVRVIVEEVCKAIWRILGPTEMAMPTMEGWKRIAEDYKNVWNFPNCLGAIDGKHVNIQCPIKAGSAFYNYKGTNSIVLMALVDAHYKFISIDVGSYGRNSDGNVFAKSRLGKALESGTLNIPEDVPLVKDNEPMPYVIVGDEAFPLKPYLLRPYPKASVQGNEQNKIFNYRLSRARRVVENAFGILSNRWRIFRTTMQIQPKAAEIVILAACCLHNMLRKNQDPEEDFEIADDISYPGFQHIEPIRRNSSQRSQHIRDTFKQYFVSPTGSVPWQIEMVRRGRSNY